jgi:hypothetical protein
MFVFNTTVLFPDRNLLTTSDGYLHVPRPLPSNLALLALLSLVLLILLSLLLPNVPSDMHLLAMLME